MNRLKSQILTGLQTFARSGASTRFRTSSVPCACKRINLDKILKRQTKTCACRRIISFDQIQILRENSRFLFGTLWRGIEVASDLPNVLSALKISELSAALKTSKGKTHQLWQGTNTQGQPQTINYMLPKKRSMEQRKGVWDREKENNYVDNEKRC